MNKNWLETEDLKFAEQLGKFDQNIGTYASLFGLTAAQLAAISDDSHFLFFIVTGKNQAFDYSKSWTDFKDKTRYGGIAALPPFPSPVNVSTPPTLVPPGIEKRFRDLVASIKADTNYSTVIGKDLGIEAPESEPLGEAKPTFKIFMDSGHPLLKWVKAGYQGVEIWGNYGAGYVKLERDFKSPFVDKHDLPAPGQSAVWKYKMKYLLEDETTGVWSDEATVTVNGEG